MKSPFAPFIRQANATICAGLIAFSVVATATGFAVAQEGPSLEELEKLVEERRIALEEAIANREATAAKVAEVQAELDQSEEQREKIAEELKSLCEEQETLNPGSFENCMSNSDS